MILKKKYWVFNILDSNMSKEEPIHNLRLEISKQLETIETYQKSYAGLSTKYVKLSEKYSPQSISVTHQIPMYKYDKWQFFNKRIVIITIPG